MAEDVGTVYFMTRGWTGDYYSFAMENVKLRQGAYLLESSTSDSSRHLYSIRMEADKQDGWDDADYKLSAKYKIVRSSISGSTEID